MEKPMSSTSSDENQIRQMMADRAAAMRAGDADAVVAQYAPEIVSFDLAPPLQHVGAEVRDAAGLRAWFAGFQGPVDYEITQLAVTAGADVAYCHSLNRLTATPQGMPQPFTLWFRGTVCLRKRGGDWRITHQHNSTPFYMDGTFRAALDLQP
jgi:ketosteroid isomerase-like protein